MGDDDARAKRIRLEEEPRHQELPHGGDGGGAGAPDLISRLPDEVLGDIITLIPTMDGALTLAVSRRWRPLWHAAPLNLEVGYGLCTQNAKHAVLATKILARHAGPGRRFALPGFRLRDRLAMVDGWLRSRALTDLREIMFSYSPENCWLPQPPMPPSALRFAATLCVARFGSCGFPNVVAPSLKFPHLKELSLMEVTISEDALHSLLAGCLVLEILLLEYNVGIGRLRISSPTLRSIGFCGPWEEEGSEATKFQELVVEDAPRLERLLPLNLKRGPATIRVMRAPKLETVGLLSAAISKLEFGTTAFQEMIALSLGTSMATVKFNRLKTMKNARIYNPLDPIECLELHLKKVAVNDYRGMRSDVDFAKFFVLNAKVYFGVVPSCSDKWMANQRRRLQVDNKASPGARFAFARGAGNSLPKFLKDDPFDWNDMGDFLRFARILD
ncbi:hypothetical protein C2845_PM04G07860 [Panicum miliaceum]|uniref:Uncharacterized protein n=1 Tax=Panicum miliaceum TaxID=4540 RepID=A0A3L6QNX1_PANMI|nr:hypothetical protein C2845_PM04G07860 [Panicum miliaceum]